MTDLTEPEVWICPRCGERRTVRFAWGHRPADRPRIRTCGTDPVPVVRGEMWQRDFEGAIGALTHDDAEAYADRIAVKRAHTLTAGEAAREYESALAKELGISPPSRSARHD